MENKTIDGVKVAVNYAQASDAPVSDEEIAAIKRALIERGLYALDKYGSMDVYRAVLEEKIKTVEEFLERYGRGRKDI